MKIQIGNCIKAFREVSKPLGSLIKRNKDFNNRNEVSQYEKGVTVYFQSRYGWYWLAITFSLVGAFVML